MNEHDRIELQRLGQQAGALGNHIAYTSPAAGRSVNVNWRRVAISVAVGMVAVLFGVAVVWLPWGDVAQFVGLPSLATCLPLTRIGATPPCVLCGSTGPCGCDLEALCRRVARREAADRAERRERQRDRLLPAGFRIVWPTHDRPGRVA